MWRMSDSLKSISHPGGRTRESSSFGENATLRKSHDFCHTNFHGMARCEHTEFTLPIRPLLFSIMANLSAVA
jgi:hypothetical protein